MTLGCFQSQSKINIQRYVFFINTQSLISVSELRKKNVTKGKTQSLHCFFFFLIADVSSKNLNSTSIILLYFEEKIPHPTKQNGDILTIKYIIHSDERSKIQ